MEYKNDSVMNGSGNNAETSKQREEHNEDIDNCLEEEADIFRILSSKQSDTGFEENSNEYKSDEIPTRNAEDEHSGKFFNQSANSDDVSYRNTKCSRESRALSLEGDREYLKNEDTNSENDDVKSDEVSQEDLTDIIQTILDETESNSVLNENNEKTSSSEISNCSESPTKEIKTVGNGNALTVEKTINNEDFSTGLPINVIVNITKTVDNETALIKEQRGLTEDEPIESIHKPTEKAGSVLENENQRSDFTDNNNTSACKTSITTENVADSHVDTDGTCRFSSCEIINGTLVDSIETERDKIGWTGDVSNGFTCDSKIFSRKPRDRKNKDQSKSPDPNSIEALVQLYKVSTNFVSRKLACGIIGFVEEKQDDTFPWRSRTLDKKIKQAKRKMEFFKSVQWVDLYECSDAVLEIFNKEETDPQEDKTTLDKCSFVCVVV